MRGHRVHRAERIVGRVRDDRLLWGRWQTQTRRRNHSARLGAVRAPCLSSCRGGALLQAKPLLELADVAATRLLGIAQSFLRKGLYGPVVVTVKDARGLAKLQHVCRHGTTPDASREKPVTPD